MWTCLWSCGRTSGIVFIFCVFHHSNVFPFMYTSTFVHMSLTVLSCVFISGSECSSCGRCPLSPETGNEVKDVSDTQPADVLTVLTVLTVPDVPGVCVTSNFRKKTSITFSLHLFELVEGDGVVLVQVRLLDGSLSDALQLLLRHLHLQHQPQHLSHVMWVKMRQKSESLMHRAVSLE